MRLYRYIGSQQIADRAVAMPVGTPIHSAADVMNWVRESKQKFSTDKCVIATFVIDAAGILLIADRHSEHVACAGRQSVQSAGEITFQIAGGLVDVLAVSNQSTGYCPEPKSWPAVVAALTHASLSVPMGFSLECEFRRCITCNNINLVKDGFYECGICSVELPCNYNV